MWNFDLLAATRAIEKSMAFVLYRLLFSLGAALGYLFAALAGAGTLIGMGSLAKNANTLGPVGAALGFAAFAYLMYRLRGYWLYALEAPHLALLAAREKGEVVPEGKAQIDYARQRLARSFAGLGALSELDRLLRRGLLDISNSRPVTVANPRLAKLLNWSLGRLASLNQASILALHFHGGADNPWRTALTGLALQQRHYHLLLKNRLYALLFEWLGFAAAFPLLWIGFEKLTADIPIALGFWLCIFAGVFAWALKAAFFEPIAEAAMMQLFFERSTETLEPAREAELAAISPALRELWEKAGD